MQDALALDTSARMNDPSSYARPVDTWHNFRWRMLPDAASELIAHRLRSLNALYGRQPAQ